METIDLARACLSLVPCGSASHEMLNGILYSLRPCASHVSAQDRCLARLTLVRLVCEAGLWGGGPEVVGVRARLLVGGVLVEELVSKMLIFV